MDQTKLTIIRAARDMARADGRLHRNERKVLRLIAEAEQLTAEEKAVLQRTSEAVEISELARLLPEPVDRVRLMELSILVAMADGVESPQELDRLRQISAQLALDKQDVSVCLERARERFFDLTREWEEADGE